MTTLTEFIIESNRIEGILRAPTIEEIEAHERILALAYINIVDVERFVMDVARAMLRRNVGMDVSVGDHDPPNGGPMIGHQLALLLEDLHDAIETGWPTPWKWHRAYETLHPFMDGNGRSGRVLWAWHTQRLGRDPFALPFLHAAYYEALDDRSR